MRSTGLASRASVMLAVAASWLASPAFACLEATLEPLADAVERGDKSAILALQPVVENNFAQDPSLQNSNDLAVVLVVAGRAHEAIELLHALEKRATGDARTAANLGAAYDAAGDADKALNWIREVATRDRPRHEWLEWLHEDVLRSKVAFERDPNYLNENGVVRPIRGVAESLEAMQILLPRRSIYVQPPDPVMAALYREAGAYQSIVLFEDPSFEQEMRLAISYLETSLRYGDSKAARDELRRAHNSLAEHARLQRISRNRMLMWGGIVICIVMGAALYLVVRRHKVQ